jgi:peptidoglycan hydrolase CwlO-like protein
MKKEYYGHDFYKSMDKIVNKVWLVVSLLIVTSLITIAIYFFNNSLSQNVDKGFNQTNEKIDSVSLTQSNILSELNSINEKLDLNNEKVIDTILDLNGDVNRLNRSIGKINNNIDTLIVYIKK